MKRIIKALLLTIITISIQAADIFKEPASETQATGWDNLKKPFDFTLASPDQRYARNQVPSLDSPSTKWEAVAWRGETISTQAVFYTKKAVSKLTVSTSGLRSGKTRLPSSSLTARFVRYTKGKGGVIPDILENEPSIPVEANTTRPVWISVKIPTRAKPGIYQGKVTIKGAGITAKSIYVKITVLKHVLPPSSKWSFHLDLWQNPFSIARVHNVELWGKEHLVLIHKYYKLLAEAGQKCITVSLVDKPWGGQTEDPFGEMIKWTKKKDGKWSYDFTIFDLYVKAAMKAGITKQINCYSMIPWSNRFQYFDAKSNSYQALTALPGSPEYEAHWRPFLKDFRKHLKQMKWLNKTCVAMDERPHAIMLKVINFLTKEAPELKIASAINYAKQEGSADLYDISVAIQHAHSIDPKYLAERTKKGMKTTFYVCCGPDRPNTFTHSPPAEAAWLGIHSAALGYSGFLRWAYNSWVKDPLMDTSFVRWEAGDCFLIYPGLRSSIRFERLREGIQFYEKYQIIQKAVAKDNSSTAKSLLKDLQKELEACTYGNVREIGAAPQVNAVKKAMTKLSQKCRAIK